MYLSVFVNVPIYKMLTDPISHTFSLYSIHTCTCWDIIKIVLFQVPLILSSYFWKPVYSYITSFFANAGDAVGMIVVMLAHLVCEIYTIENWLSWSQK